MIVNGALDVSGIPFDASEVPVPPDTYARVLTLLPRNAVPPLVVENTALHGPGGISAISVGLVPAALTAT